jgi:CBS domain containing-hemolysin-like protein
MMPRKRHGCRRVVVSEPDGDHGMSSAWILLGVAAVLIVGNAVFVAAETALVTVDRNLVESRAREGSVRFGRVRGTLQRLSTYLSGAQLGITVTSLAIGFVAEPSVATLLRGPLGALGFDADVAEVIAVAVACSWPLVCRWCSASLCRRTSPCRALLGRLFG